MKHDKIIKILFVSVIFLFIAYSYVVKSKHTISIDNKVSEINDAMLIYKAGYYSGAIRQQEFKSVDSTWQEDSASFRKHIFSIQTKKI